MWRTSLSGEAVSTMRDPVFRMKGRPTSSSLPMSRRSRQMSENRFSFSVKKTTRRPDRIEARMIAAMTRPLPRPV
jgi:hypothetical protein